MENKQTWEHMRHGQIVGWKEFRKGRIWWNEFSSLDVMYIKYRVSPHMHTLWIIIKIFFPLDPHVIVNNLSCQSFAKMLFPSKHFLNWVSFIALKSVSSLRRRLPLSCQQWHCTTSHPRKPRGKAGILLDSHGHLPSLIKTHPPVKLTPSSYTT